MKTVAVLGASSRREKFGNKAVRAYDHAGWKVLPVNPSGGEIEGHQALTSLEDLPRGLDRITVYLPPPVTLSMLPALAAADAGDVYFNPGSADGSVLEEAEKLGIRAVDACSIVAIGLSPSQFP